MRRAARLRMTGMALAGQVFAGLALTGLALTGLTLPARAQETQPLQLYQLVRSLQLVQDRIAGGDHATLPMQAKLLEMIDANLRATGPQDLKTPENFRALLVYGMSGGNPLTVKTSSARIALDSRQRALMDGVLAYLGGQPAVAIEALKPVDPMAMPADIGAFIALVKGSLLGAEKPEQALALLDQARLLSPGTLVEEAALRRSVGIAISVGDAARFTLASTQYVERFLHSPYASQFADSFVAGVVAMSQTVSREKIADITAMMDTERERVIYLRIARSAAIAGLTELSAFAAAKAQADHLPSGPDDPRGQLYSSLSALTSATIPELQQALQKIDRTRLSESDRKLLDAAQIVAQEVIAAPPPILAASADATAVAANRDTSGSSAEPSAAATAVDDSGLPPVEGALPPVEGALAPVGDNMQETASGQQVEKPSPPVSAGSDQNAADASMPDATASPVAAPANDPTAAAIARTKRKLDMIDQLLGVSPQ